jgi:hypothetical protein
VTKKPPVMNKKLASLALVREFRLAARNHLDRDSISDATSVAVVGTRQPTRHTPPIRGWRGPRPLLRRSRPHAKEVHIVVQRGSL